MRGLLHFITRIGDGYSKTTITHYGEIDDVISDKPSLTGRKPFLFKYFLENRQLVLDTLVDVVEFEIASAKGYCFRNALGD